MPAPTIPSFQPSGTQTARRNAVDRVQDRLMAVLDADLKRSGKWARWCRAEPRLEGVASLGEAVATWRRRDPHSYQVVAALTRIGSRHGGDDDHAALAVVVVLAPGIARLADIMADVCEVDDVRAQVWEVVKAAEPQLGSCAARYLLRRARQQLMRPGAGLVPSGHTVSLDECLGWDGPLVYGDSRRDRTQQVYDWDPNRRRGHDADRMAIAVPEVEDPVGELCDLLDWARGEGVVEPGDVDLLVEFVAAANYGLGTEDALRLVGARRGLTMRTIRRRRDAIVARLRDAAPDYLAATA